MTAGASFDLRILDRSGNEGYLGDRLPSVRDEEIIQLITAAGAAGELQELSSHLSDDHVPVLLAFAERMATLAVRSRERERVCHGLVAAGLTLAVADRHDALPVLSLLWRSGEHLGLDPGAEFTATADALGCDELRQFATRDPDDRSIDSMGYVEAQEEDGFRYQRTW